MHLVAFEGRFYSLVTLQLSKTPLKEKGEEEEARASKGIGFGCESKDHQSYTRINFFLNSLFF